MSGHASMDSSRRSSGDVWRHVTRAVKYAESVLGGRFNGDGNVLQAKNRGFMRKRLLKLLECFSTTEGADVWIRAACFKSKLKGQDPMAYFVGLIRDALEDPTLRNLTKLLTIEELQAFCQLELAHARERAELGRHEGNR